jgi:exonuclease VII large subunit
MEDLVHNYDRYFMNIINQKKLILDRLTAQFQQNSIHIKLDNMQNNLINIKNNFNTILNNILNSKEKEIKLLLESFILNEPSKRLKKGLVQVFHKNSIVDLSDLVINDTVEITDTKIYIKAQILEKKTLS